MAVGDVSKRQSSSSDQWGTDAVEKLNGLSLQGNSGCCHKYLCWQEPHHAQAQVGSATRNEHKTRRLFWCQLLFQAIDGTARGLSEKCYTMAQKHNGSSLNKAEERRRAECLATRYLQ